jgi:hypothetical protein
MRPWPSRRPPRARAWKGSGDAASSEVWFDIAEREGATEFTGYTATSGEAWSCSSRMAPK